MDKKTEPTIFSAHFNAEAPHFMQEPEAIKAIRKSDLSRLFNDFEYTLSDDEYHTIMDAHAKGPVEFIQALEKIFQPICQQFFNAEMTSLKEPYRSQIRAHFGASRADEAVDVFDVHTNLFLQDYFDTIVYDEDNPLEKAKPNFEAAYKKSITPIQTFKEKKRERVKALLRVVRAGDDTKMQAAIEQFKKDEAEDCEDFIKALDEYAKQFDEKNEDGTPKYPDGTPGKLSRLKEEDKKKFRETQKNATDFIAESFEMMNEQKLVNETLSGIATTYNLALTSYPGTKRAEEAKSSEETADVKEERDAKAREETVKTADAMADIGTLVNTVPTNPKFKLVFSDAADFMAGTKDFYEAEALLFRNRATALEMKKSLLLDEIAGCESELWFTYHLTSKDDQETIGELAGRLRELREYVDKNIHSNMKQSAINSLIVQVEGRMNLIQGSLNNVSAKQLSPSQRVTLSYAWNVFLNALATMLGYTPNTPQTPQETVNTSKERSIPGVEQSIASITAFKEQLANIRRDTNADKAMKKVVDTHQEQQRIHLKQEKDRQDFSSVQTHYEDSPVDLTHPQPNKQGSLIYDWQRAWDQAEVHINGKPLKECTPRFKNDEDVLNFFRDILLEKVDPSKKDAAVKYLKEYFQQTGLLWPVKKNMEEHLKKTTEQTPQWGTPSPMGSKIEIYFNIIPTEKGFKIDDRTEFKVLLAAPHKDTGAPNRFAAYVDESGLLLHAENEGDNIIEAHGVIDVDFSKDPAHPTLIAEKNTITYGHRALADALHPSRPNTPDSGYTTGESSDEDSPPPTPSRK